MVSSFSTEMELGRSVSSRGSSTSAPPYAESALTVRPPAVSERQYANDADEAAGDDSSLSERKDVVCGLHRQSRYRVVSTVIAGICVVLLACSCAIPRWLVRRRREVLFLANGEITARNSSAISMGLFVLCDVSAVATPCYSYSEAQQAENSRVFWDVDLQQNYQQFLASRALCIISLVMSLVTVVTSLCHCQARTIRQRFTLTVAHAISSLLTCLSSILCTIIFFFWSDESLRQQLTAAAAASDRGQGGFSFGLSFFLLCSVVMVSFAMSLTSLYTMCTSPRGKATAHDDDSDHDDGDNEERLQQDEEQATLALRSCDLPPPYSADIPPCTCDCFNAHSTDTSRPAPATNVSSDNNSYLVASVPYDSNASSTFSRQVSSSASAIPRNHSTGSIGMLARHSAGRHGDSSPLSRTLRPSHSSPMLHVIDSTSLSPIPVIRSSAGTHTHGDRCVDAAPVERTVGSMATSVCWRCQPAPLLSPQELLRRYADISALFNCSSEGDDVISKSIVADLPPPYIDQEST